MRKCRTGTLASVLAALSTPLLAEPPLVGDANCDDVVDQADANIIALNYGLSGDVTVLDGDVNRDRVVDSDDYFAVLANYGQSLPPIPPLQGIDVTAVLDAGNMITVTDNDTGDVIISPNLHEVWQANPDEHHPDHPALEPAIQFVPRSDGFDLVLTYANPDDQVRSLGTVYIPGIRFGSSIVHRDFYVDGKEQIITRPPGQNYFGRPEFYPGVISSPVKYIGEADPFDSDSDEYIIGVSIQYPILDYKHAVDMHTDSPGGQYTYGGQNWEVRIALNPKWCSINTCAPYSEEGEIQPGETRKYVVTCRIMKRLEGQHENEWMRLYHPYRRYFRCLYGMPRFQRDGRPVCSVTTTQLSACSGASPLGFINEALRPDTNGWGPWADHWSGVAATGWERFMVWSPTGLYCTAQHNNYPFQFTSHWNDVPPMAASLAELEQFTENTGAGLGLWWGRAAQVMREWEDPDDEPLDPSNDEHVFLAMSELSGAAGVNASMVGLDAFSYLPVWESYWWLQDMQAAYPGIAMITEPIHPDLMQTLAPTYLLGTRPLSQTGYRVRNPHYLTDFLSPGHEIWAGIHQHHLMEELGHWPSQQEILDAMVEFAGWGYVAAPFAEPAISGNVNAAQSWLTTVPPDLRP
ncbi:MAG TPA: hypothetical protein VFF69_09775 [Phycisphaerales bacterium]|nr:hypothetical protein [Phycisphaerales bacterium]